MTKTKYIVSNCNNIGIKQMGKFEKSTTNILKLKFNQIFKL